MDGDMTVFWSWPPRAMSVEDIYERMRKSVDALAAIHPCFRGWQVSDGLQMLAHMAGGKGRERGTRPPAENALMGEPSAGRGFLVWAAAPEQLAGWPEGLQLVCANGTRPAPLGHSGVMLHNVATLDILSYDILKNIIFALIPIWRAAFVRVYPRDIDSDRRTRRAGIFGISWMVWLCPELAKDIGPISGIINEPTPDGGILLAATKDAFDLSDASHEAAAERLWAALAPVNGT